MRMNPDEQFTAIADRLSGVGDSTLRAALAMEIFGRTGSSILPMIEGGRGGMARMRAEARRLGLVTSTQAAEGASRLQDKLDVLTLVGKKLYSALGSALVPMFTEMANRAIRSGAAAIKWVKDHRELVIVAFKVAAGLFAAGAAAYAAGRMISAGLGAIGTVAGVLKFGMSLFGTLGSLLMGLLSPIGLMVGGLAVLGGYLLYTSGYGGKALEWLGAKFQDLLGVVSDVIGGISDALAAGDIGLAAKVLWMGLRLAWETGVGSLNKVWLQGKRWFLTQCFEMWSGALSSVEFAWHGIKVGWIETTAFLSKAWNTCTTAIAKGWQWTSSYLAVQWATVQNLLTKGWNELKGLWDDGFDVAAANEVADKALVEAEQGVNKQRDDNLRRINSEHAAQMKALEAERKAKETAETKRHEDRLRGINEHEDKNVADLSKSTDEKVAAAQAGLDEATRNYQAARAQAKHAREQAPNADIGTVKKPRDAFGDIEDLMARKISQAGTFNPMAVRGLGPDATTLRIARATEQTAENTRRLRTNAGLSFE